MHATQVRRLVMLTERGRAVIDAVTAREHEQLRRVGGDLTRADVDTCMRVLSHMLAALDEIEPDD
jgi:DNA-binding MarR family transcriptional regulator